MKCSIMDLQEKFVIDGSTGNRIGYVSDVELDTEEAKLNALIVSAKSRSSLLSKSDKIRVDWEDIRVIGADSIIVSGGKEYGVFTPPKSIFEKFWN